MIRVWKCGLNSRTIRRGKRSKLRQRFGSSKRQVWRQMAHLLNNLSLIYWSTSWLSKTWLVPLAVAARRQRIVKFGNARGCTDDSNVTIHDFNEVLFSKFDHLFNELLLLYFFYLPMNLKGAHVGPQGVRCRGCGWTVREYEKRHSTLHNESSCPRNQTQVKVEFYLSPAGF